MDNDVTFIIPSKGRDTIRKSIDSLIHQTSQNWKAIIVFDNVTPPPDLPNDSRISIIQLKEKMGDGFNGAGVVRNQGMAAADTPWIAFLDDDDYVLPTYVNRFQLFLTTHPVLDVFVYRMYDDINKRILPEPGVNEIKKNKTGISFLVRTDLIRKHKLEFKNSKCEDYDFLEAAILAAGGKYHLSNSIPYMAIGGEKNADSVYNKG